MVVDVQQGGTVNRKSLAKMCTTVFILIVSCSRGSPALWTAEGRMPTWHPTWGLHLIADLPSYGTDCWVRTWAQSGQ